MLAGKLSSHCVALLMILPRLSAVGTSQSYSQRFIVHLLGKLLDTTSSKFVRIAAAAYLGSYSSRASYLPINLVKDTISVFMDWALRYLNTIEPQNPTTNSPTFHNSPTNSHIKLAKQKQNGPSNSIDYTIDVELHALFYMVSQSIFYIFCFHHKELLKTANLESFAAGVQRVVESKLNPFKVCVVRAVYLPSNRACDALIFGRFVNGLCSLLPWAPNEILASQPCVVVRLLSLTILFWCSCMRVCLLHKVAQDVKCCIHNK